MVGGGLAQVGGEAHGYDMYDYHVRGYYPAIMRTTTIDPLAEDYYEISPYVWCGNNPVNRVDLDGMDWYVFGEDEEDESKFNRRINRDGEHRMVVKNKDKDGNLHFKFYDFADPENDPKNIDQGRIDRFEMLSEPDVRGIMDGQGGFDIENSSLAAMFFKSSGGGSFDYSMSGGMNKYMRSKGREEKLNSSLYIVNGDIYAHNRMNFGNFLWGATGYTLGYSQETLLKIADLNSRYNPGLRNSYKGQPDSLDDQLSITRGTIYAEKNLYRYKTKISWLRK